MHETCRKFCQHSGVLPLLEKVNKPHVSCLWWLSNNSRSSRLSALDTRYMGYNCKVTHHIEINQLASATCFSFHNLASDITFGILIVCIYKDTFQATKQILLLFVFGIHKSGKKWSLIISKNELWKEKHAADDNWKVLMRLQLKASTGNTQETYNAVRVDGIWLICAVLL